jgi:nucleotide-binding universal stress UspA family protein
MIRDILAHIPTERTMKPVVDASVSLASLLGARIEAVATGYVAASTYMLEGAAGTAVAAVFEVEETRAKDRTMAALAVFETEARSAGISYHCHSMVDLPEEAMISISAASRLRDLSIVLQPEPGKHTFDNAVSTEILFQSGGPVLFIPYIFRGIFKPRRISVCWDRSRLAARSLRGAEPFLRQAEAISVISVNDDTTTTSSEASPEQLVKHLARYCCPVRLIKSEEAWSSIQPAILSLATDESADMLVMGAYGHSRLQENVLGGVTREMLKTMTIPTLMTH